MSQRLGFHGHYRPGGGNPITFKQDGEKLTGK